jgi:hypothetical protein
MTADESPYQVLEERLLRAAGFLVARVVFFVDFVLFLVDLDLVAISIPLGICEYC